ncbi:hypothetical protein KR054_011077, partial [Drosophila jambulina]
IDLGNSNHTGVDNSPGKASRCRWTDEEVDSFFGIISQLKLQTPLRKTRNAKVFKVISREMAKRNCPKSAKQLRIKYHQLRRQYARARNGGESFEHFAEVHELVQGNECSDFEAELESESDAEGEEDMVSESEEEDALEASSSSLHTNARCKWTEGEVDLLFDLIHTLGLRSALLRKRNAKVFRLLAKEMAKRNSNKGADKLRIKFQLLRRMYNKVKNGTGDTFEHFEAMRQVLDPTEEEAAAAEAEANVSSASEGSEFNDSEDDEGDTSQRSGTHFWTDEEVDAFLLIIRDNGFFRALDGSRKRNFQTLVHISNILAKQAIKRTPHQLRNKLRLLFKRHREAKEHGLENVRILPRHFKLFDEITGAPSGENRKRASSQRPMRPLKASSLPKQSPVKLQPESDSEEESSSTCDLLRAGGDDYDEDFDDAAGEKEPTPLESLKAIIEGQKHLLAQIKSANEAQLRQQRAQQQQFLQEVTQLMRREREETLRRISEMLSAP